MPTWLDHRVPRYLGKYYLGLCLWGCFETRLIFQSVDRVKQVALLWMGLIQAVEGLSSTKRWRKEEFAPLPDRLSRNSCLFPSPRTRIHTVGSPGTTWHTWAVENVQDAVFKKLSSWWREKPMNKSLCRTYERYDNTSYTCAEIRFLKAGFCRVDNLT